MKLNTINILLAGTLCITACNTNERKEKDSTEVAEDMNEKAIDGKMEEDAEFAVEAANGGMLEVQLGQLSQTNGASASIKTFGMNMVTDHTKANDELKALAMQKNITLPDKLGEKFQKDYDDLASKKGNDFDKAYADYMVDDHKEDIEEFKEESEKGVDAELKSWAGGKIPVLEHHLHMIEAIRDSLKK